MVFPISSNADMNPVDRLGTQKSSFSFGNRATKDLEKHVQKAESSGRPLVIFNNDVDRVLDFDHLLTVSFQSSVTSVGFSPDNSLVAVGCNNLAAIFNAGSGQILYRWELLDGEGDSYISELSFHPSPFRNILAFGGEDKLLRVSPARSHKVSHNGTRATC